MTSSRQNCALILDLDDTIFQTKSIDQQIFDPFFADFFSKIQSFFDRDKMQCISNDLWKYSWDVVLENHKIPKEIFLESLIILESAPLNLNISTYSDYHFLNQYNANKFLVTTGLTYLQKAKINALNIENDFNEIIINDRLVETKTKLDIFGELRLKYNLVPEKTYVIGDNPNAEILAGNTLNFNTIQVVRDTVEKGNNAKYYIQSFEELRAIINQ